MTTANTVDVTAVLEKAQPTAEEVEGVRGALNRDSASRKQLNDLITSMPAEPTDATDSKVAVRKGLALWAVGREKEAADWLAHSGTKIATLFRARALVSSGRPAAALELLGDPEGDPRAAEILGEAHANLGHADETSAMAAVAKKGGGSAAAAYLTGRAAELTGDRSGARAAYEAAAAADGDHGPALFHRARMEFAYGDEDRAIELYRKCLDTSAPPVNAYLNLGNLYEDRGEFTKARDAYRAILRVDATNDRARLFLGDASASVNMFYDEDLERRADKRSQVLRLPVTDFELSVRSRNCLAKMGVRTLGDLIQRSENELLSYKNFGETSLQEIKDILAQKGMRLGMGKDDVGGEDRARSILEGIGDDDAGAHLERPLSELELSVRSRHCMSVLALKTVGDLCDRSEAELMTIKNFGQTSMNEVKQKLAELGLSLKAAPKLK